MVSHQIWHILHLFFNMFFCQTGFKSPGGTPGGGLLSRSQNPDAILDQKMRDSSDYRLCPSQVQGKVQWDKVEKEGISRHYRIYESHVHQLSSLI